MLAWEDLTRFLYILARMSGFVQFGPIMGRRNLPGTFRAGLILTLGVFVYSCMPEAPVPQPATAAEFMVRCGGELLLGFALGMVMHFFFAIPHLAGFLVDTQMGMTMNQIYDQGSQGNTSVTGSLLNGLMLLLFFAANGHHTLMRILLSSGDVVPFGAAGLGTEAAQAMMVLFIECMTLSIKLSMPILAAELVGQLGMGLLMKAIPQINVFSINIELKVLIGIALLFLLISPMSEFLLDAEMEMLHSLETMLKIA